MAGEGFDKNGRAFISIAGIGVAVFVAGASAAMFILGKDAKATVPASILATAEQIEKLDRKLTEQVERLTQKFDRSAERYEDRLRKLEDDAIRRQSNESRGHR